MSEKNTHLTLKVLLGYSLLVIVTAVAVFYILDVMKKATVEDGSEQEMRFKLNLITHTLSLLNESAIFEQPIGTTQENRDAYDKVMDMVQANLAELRLIVNDSLHIQSIDTIDVLLKKKRQNTLVLFRQWRELNSTLAQNMNKIRNLPLLETPQINIPEQIEIIRDSIVVVPREKRNFFRRLRDVFVPEKQDTSILVDVRTETRTEMRTDTLVSSAYNRVDTLTNLLDGLTREQQKISYQLYEKAAQLRFDADLINRRINQILRDLEDEELNASLTKMEERRALFFSASRFLGAISIVAIVIIVIFSAIVGRDIARKRYYRRQLEEANRYAEDLLHKRERLMLTISHDIRAPMSSILGYIELLLRRDPDERQRYYLENMIGSSRHILQLVNDLLDSHRLESGQMEMEKVAFNVKSLFDEIYTSFKPLAEAKGLQLNLESDEAGMGDNYEGDSLRIRQVIGNLLSNAIKFTCEGSITLRVSVVDSLLRVSVQDTGSGIPEEEQNNIFGEFTRLQNESKAEGFGLGLSITRKLIELMEGSVSLKSVVGEGSEFIVELPLGCVEGPATPEVWSEGGTEEQNIVLANREINCLLVDDDAIQLALTGEFLKQGGVQIETCINPYQVVDLISKKKFDIIISDIQMPGLDGFELVKQIRSSGIPGTDILPIVALSASVGNDNEHYLKAGFTGFLNKPFTSSELIELLNNLLVAELHVDAKLNFTSLTDFAGEDKEALLSILRTFREETTNNMDLLISASEEVNYVQAAKVAHKMIPVFVMIGANTVVQRLRLLEKREEDLSDELWKSLILELKKQVSEIMADVSAYILSVESVE